MIDHTTFSSEWISSFPEADSLAKRQTIEKCVHAFYLLERLAKKGFPFVFKGGTSLMLLLPEPKRFSVDIDIIMDFPKEENETTELKKSTNEKREAMESICSILNKWGEGDLFFGITPKGDVVGQQVSEKTLRELSQLVETSIRPQIFPIIKKYDLENGLAVAHIHFKGAEQPYANEGRYYKRVADEDKLMCGVIPYSLWSSLAAR